jgi:hypothetical protein
MNMTRARRAISVFVLVMLLALGAGWIAERAMRGFHALGGAEIRGSHSDVGVATGEPAKPKDTVRPAATRRPRIAPGDEEYDRSDLILSSGVAFRAEYGARLFILRVLDC